MKTIKQQSLTTSIQKTMKHLNILLLFLSFLFTASAQNPNQALNFDGVDDYVSLNANVNFTANSYTIEFWIKRDVNSGGYIYGMGNTFAANKYMHIGWVTADVLRFGFIANNLDANVGNDGLWHHYAFTYNSATPAGSHNRFIYKDGVVVASDEAAPYTGASNTEIGSASILGNNDYYKGSMDRLAISLGAKTAQQLNDQKFCETSTGGLVSLYDFQDNPNGTILSTLDNNPIYFGTLNNFALSGTTSNWVSETAYEISHFSAPMPDQQVVEGGSFTLDANFVVGDCTLGNVFQWTKDGQVIPDQDDPIMSVSSVTSADYGVYRLQVSYNGGSIISNPVNITPGVDFTASQGTSDYFTDVTWTLPITPCLLDDNQNPYGYVTVQLMGDGSQIDFQTFNMAALSALYANDEPIVGAYRDFIGPNATKTYTINVFVGLLGGIDTDCFGLTATGNTLPLQNPELSIISGFSDISVGIKNKSDAASSYEILRDGALIHTITDPGAAELDSLVVYKDAYVFNNVTRIKSGQAYQYEVKMVSSLINEITDYDLGMASTLDVNLTNTSAPTNTEKVDLQWTNQYACNYDEIEIRRDNRRIAVQLNSSSAYTDFNPFFGDSIDYQLRFIQNDTIKADFSNKTYLEGNGVIAGRVITQEGLFPVDEVQVFITRKSTGEKDSVLTDPAGQFSFPNIAYGLLDSFDISAKKESHTFVYPRETIGLSSRVREATDVVVIDNFKYLEGNTTHTINSFTATPIANEDRVVLDWSLATNAPTVFIDLIRNGDIIYSSTDLADLTGSFVDLGGVPKEDTKYEIRIYTISGSTVSSNQNVQEIVFPDVSAVPFANFIASEQQVAAFNGSSFTGTGNIEISWSHTSNNFDRYRIYRNEVLIAELENNNQYYLDEYAPFDSSLFYSITVIRNLNETTYETENPTIANVLARNPMPAPSNISAFQQSNDPSILINWAPPSEVQDGFEYAGFFVYRNDELIATRYGAQSNFVFDKRGFGLSNIIYSVSLFKNTVSGIIESERVMAAPVDFPTTADVPSFTSPFLEFDGPNSVRLRWERNANLSTNISYYLLKHNDNVIARVPPYEGRFTHFPSSGFNQEYKIHVVNLVDSIEYISSNFETINVNYGPTGGNVYAPQNFKASRNLPGHIKLCWEYLDFIPSQFIIYRNEAPIDTLPVGARSYFDYTNSEQNVNFVYSIRAFQGSNFSTYVGDYGTRSEQRLIYGTITDVGTNNGIANVEIEIDYLGRKVLAAYTDSTGYYSFLSPQAYANFNLGIVAIRNGQQIMPSSSVAAENSLRVDFESNILDRPVTEGQGTAEYADHYINPYTLDGDISWRITNDDYDGVEVYRGFDLLAKVPIADGNVYTDSTAVPGIEYPYFVRTYKDGINGLTYSGNDSVMITYPPVAPVINLSATPQPNINQVLVQWSHLYEHADGYRVSVNGDPQYIVLADSLFLYYDSLGIAGQEYTYQIEAFKVIKGIPYFSMQKEVSAIYPEAAAPQNLVVSIPNGEYIAPMHLNYINLDWDYLGANVEVFNVFRDGELIAAIAPDINGYADYEAIPQVNSTYSVSAIINQNGTKNESKRVSGQISVPSVSQPPLFGPLGATDGTVNVSWRYHAQGIDRFIVRATSDGGFTVRDQEYNGELFYDNQQLHQLKDKDGTPGDNIEYSVAAISVRDGVEYISPFAFIGTITYPYPPTPAVSASDGVYEKAIEVNWSINADSGVDSFRLRRYDNANGIWKEIGNVGPEQRSYLDQFTPDDIVAPNYIYYVAACRIIDGVLNCYIQSEGSDNGTLKSPTLDTEIVGDPNSSFGASVDIYQDWMAVGDPDSRKVTIYQFINDEWVESFMLPSNFDGFGYSVAIWDDFLVVGAPFNSVDNGPDLGRVETYQRNANGVWIPVQSIATNNTGFRFGRSVDVEGDIIVVASDGLGGTVGDQISSTFTVYKNVNGVIDQLTVDPTPTTFPYNNWTSVAGSRQVHIEGNDIFMNTLNVTEAGNPDGLVLHYKLNSGQTNAEFQSGFTEPNSFLGVAMDVDNGKLAIASLLPTTFQGITHIYTYNGTAWNLDASLTDPTNQLNSSASVDLKGNLLAISNKDHPNLGQLQRIYLYREVAGNYSLIQSPNQTDPNFRSDFLNTDLDRRGYGNEIALTDDRIIISDSRGFSPVNPTLYFFDIYTPEVLTLTATDGTLLRTRLDWTSECPDCPIDYIDHFNIYRDSELIAEVDGTLSQFQDNPVNLLSGASPAVEGQVYTYEVSAVSGISRESTKVSAQGYSKRNGIINGNVYVLGTNSGVPGVTIEARGVDPLTTTPYSYTTTSQSDGSFILSGLFVTEASIDYQIIPSFGTNELEVFGSDTRPLSIADPEEELIIINDKTAFVIAGHATNNVSNCGIEGVKVKYYHTINNVESVVDSTITDKDGMYSILVKPTLPNLQQIKIEIQDLKITSNAQGGSDTIQYQFLSPVSTYSNFENFPMSSTLNFEESLVYPLSIIVQNACQNPVADQPIAMRISSIDGCLEMTAQTDNNGQLNIDLPPNDYLIAVEALVGSGVTNYENSAIDYLRLRQYNFDLLSVHTEAGGAAILPTVDPILFEYHRATSFVLSTSFDRYKCDDPMQPAIITQGDNHSMNISITENHTAGESCEVYGGYIRVLNPAASGKTVDTLESTGGAFPGYSFTVGAPNLVSPYTFGISFQYFSEDGNLLGQRVISVIAEGQRQLPGTGIITESSRDEAGNLQFPLLVLRDPPGDGSSASIASGATINKSISFSSENKGSIGFHLESDFSLFKLGGFLNLDVGLGGGIAKSSSFDINFETDQTYSTSSSEDAVGRGADVIVGSGLSQQYGLSRSLFFENGNCDAKSETTYSFGIGGFQSTYSYTIDFIENLIETYTRDSILIELGDLVYTKPSGDDYTVDESRERVSALISTWKEMIHYHDVETVPHYVLCSDFGYKKDELSPEAIALYADWQNSFCTLIGDYNGEEFIMDEQIEWTPTLINAYNNTVAYTDKLKDPLTDISQGDLGVADLDIESGSLGITNAYHALLGNQLKSADVYDISGNVLFEKSITARQSSSTSQALSSFFYLETAFGVNVEAQEAIGVIGPISTVGTINAKAGVKITTNASIGISHAQAESNTSTITYSIFDDDAEDQITFIALQAPLQDHTPYFIRLGGLSSCPPEEALTVGQDNDPLLIDDFEMAVVIDPETGATTPQPNPSFNVDPDEAEVFEIKISNEGPTNQVRDAQIFLDLASNPTGAIVKIGGSNLNIVSPVFSVPAGGSLTQFLTVERPPLTDFYNFKDLRIGIRPACGGEAEYIDLSVFFKSPCSDVSLTMPLDHYVLNRISPSISGDAEVIPFEIRDYDSSDSSNLEYVQLQYRRLGNNSGWQNVPRDEGNFTKAELFIDDSADSPGVDPSFFNEWVVTGWYNLIPDGDYLLRAQSYCGTSGINLSNEVNMNVRRSAFIITGYPEPADGIWTDGADGPDEISTTFSTDIDCDIINTTDSIEQYLTLHTIPSMMEVPFTYICQNDKLTLVPSVDMSTLDGETVRATYQSIFNLAGNTAEKVVWDFKVVTTAVDWSDEDVELTVYQDEVTTISTSIFNTTGGPVSGLSISGAANLPWLSIDPSGSFTVGSGGDGVDLNFNLGGDLPTGEYTTTLMINGLGGGRTPELPVTLNVIERPPFPDINASFTDSMQMVLNWAFTHDNIKSTDIRDAIYVYNNGQLVGGGNITVEGNFYYAKIKVYGNNNGDLLDFVVWNADQQLAYSAIGSSSIPFEANSASVGLISDPNVILVNDDLFEIAKRIYVDHTNTGVQNGLSWNTAFRDLQDGIAVAFAGDEIWIAEGTYKPTAGGDRTSSYTITEAISIYGGFTNTMDELEERTGANETILSGDLLIQGAATDNSYHVMESTSTDLLLDMLTIANGNADGTGSDDKGACFYNTGNVTLKNMKMSGGQATNAGTLIYNNGQMIIDGGTFIIPAIPTVSNLYNDTGGLITVRQNVEIKK